MGRLLRDIGYFVILLLMIVGVTGVLVHAIGENGWIERFFGVLVHQGMAAIFGIVLGLLVVGWLARRWLIASQRNVLLNDFLMYAMVALGALFLARLVLYGTL